MLLIPVWSFPTFALRSFLGDQEGEKKWEPFVKLPSPPFRAQWRVGLLMYFF